MVYICKRLPFTKNPDQYQDLLQQALRELESFKRKYQSLKELKELFKVIDEIVK